MLFSERLGPSAGLGARAATQSTLPTSGFNSCSGSYTTYASLAATCWSESPLGSATPICTWWATLVPANRLGSPGCRRTVPGGSIRKSPGVP